MPEKCIVALPYFVTDSVNTTGAASFAKVFQSSAYQPEQGGAFTGHQPLGYDQWTYFFQNCRVYGITGTVKFTNNTAEKWVVALEYTDSLTSFPTVASNTAWEQPGVKPKIMGLEGGGHDVVTCAVHWSPSKLLGYSKEQYRTEIATMGTMGNIGVGANPVIMTFMAGMAWTVNGALSAGGSVSVLYDLVLHCELLGRKVLPGS